MGKSREAEEIRKLMIEHNEAIKEATKANSSFYTYLIRTYLQPDVRRYDNTGEVTRDLRAVKELVENGYIMIDRVGHMKIPSIASNHTSPNSRFTDGSSGQYNHKRRI